MCYQTVLRQSYLWSRYEGVCAEARVVSTIRAGIFVDLFGVETYIPLSELSYQRMLDASHVYQPGQRVLVKILELDRSDPVIISQLLHRSNRPARILMKRHSGCTPQATAMSAR